MELLDGLADDRAMQDAIGEKVRSRLRQFDGERVEETREANRQHEGMREFLDGGPQGEFRHGHTLPIESDTGPRPGDGSLLGDLKSIQEVASHATVGQRDEGPDWIAQMRKRRPSDD
jgi:hypothetical protein